MLHLHRMPVGHLPSFLEHIHRNNHQIYAQTDTTLDTRTMFGSTVGIERYPFSGIDADLYIADGYVLHIDTGDM